MYCKGKTSMNTKLKFLTCTLSMLIATLPVYSSSETNQYIPDPYIQKLNRTIGAYVDKIDTIQQTLTQEEQEAIYQLWDKLGIPNAIIDKNNATHDELKSAMLCLSTSNEYIESNFSDKDTIKDLKKITHCMRSAIVHKMYVNITQTPS